VDVPAELKYSKEHEWIKVEGNQATIGITDYAQGELGDIVFVELPNIGDEFDQGQSFGTIEAVKAVSDIYSPLSGKVLEVNGVLDDNPMAINSNPYGDGWLIKLEMKDISEVDGLLDAEGYKGIMS